MTHVALFFHLFGAFVFVSGAVVAGVASEAARRKDDVREVAALLSIARIGAAFLGAGGVLVLGFGLWLVHLTHTGFGAGWVDAALALFVAAGATGGIGGRRPRRARELAQQGGPLPDVRRLLDDPLSRAANYASAAMVVAILALMIWQP
ncbi:MAG TPA: DUF2269 family protein [Gaiellaceae bacterium]|nr:DUF2269 family protein [Gaiellaceae bacterium]